MLRRGEELQRHVTTNNQSDQKLGGWDGRKTNKQTKWRIIEVCLNGRHEDVVRLITANLVLLVNTLHRCQKSGQFKAYYPNYAKSICILIELGNSSITHKLCEDLETTR